LDVDQRQLKKLATACPGDRNLWRVEIIGASHHQSPGDFAVLNGDSASKNYVTNSGTARWFGT